MESKLNQADWDKPETTGTTIMAISYDGGVVVAADSRTSSGSYIPDRTTDKLDYLTDRIFCLRSGSAADTQTICHYVRHYLGMHSIELGKTPYVKTAANLFRQILYNNKDALLAGIIIAGWDPYEGAQVFSLPLGGSCTRVPYAIGGSGSGFIYGYCDANFKEKMTFEEARTFAINAISLAMSRDGSSGGCVRLVNINKDAFKREFVPYTQVPFK